MGSLHLFRDLPEVRPFAPGEYIFRKGDAGTEMYMVIEGEVDLLVGRAVVETAKPGAFMGEMALILPSRRTASARARTDCRIFPIDAERFQELVRETPSFALDVMKALALRLRRTTEHMALAHPAARARKRLRRG
jgi:CRP/FNR family transcriptional regulator, cyclic AMP receptor protein